MLKQHLWLPGWDAVVPGHFGSIHFTDLLFYRRSDGLAGFYRTDGLGDIDLLKQHTWSTAWDAIVPGNFAGSGLTDLLLYKSSAPSCCVDGRCVDTA